MTSDNRTIPPSLYFQEAVTLRLNLEWNLADYRFSREGGRIIYLVDANVVIFFLNPKSETRHIALSSEHLIDNLVGTAIITAEFLFSRGLAGQNELPPLLAPSHAEDLWGVCNAILRRSSDERSDFPDRLSARAREKLKLLIESVRSGDMPIEQAARVLVHEVTQATAIISDDIRDVYQLLRLYKNDMIRPLSVHPNVTGEILSVGNSNPDRVKRWTNRILEERQAQKRSEPPGRYPLGATRKKAQRDAEALVQTIMLDDAARRDGQHTRYVMITADRALYDAYAQWYWNDTQGVAGGRRFILRTPLQYVPLLNIAEMPNGIENSDEIQRIYLALDTLLAPLRAADPNRYPLNLSIIRILAKLAADDERLRSTIVRLYDANPYELSKGGSELFDRIRNDWQRCFDASVVLNAELMQRRMQAEFAPLALLLRDDLSLRDCIQDFQKQAFEELQGAHLAINARVSIRRLMGEIGPNHAASRGRAPLAVRTRFSRVLDNRSLHVTLDEIARGADYNLLARVDEALQRQMDYETWFFAACVAYRCGRWNTALQHATNALERLRSEGTDVQNQQRIEISYIIAASTRYALPNVDAIRRALGLLTDSIDYSRKHEDNFGLSRALSERCSLVLHLLYNSYFLAGSLSPLQELQLDPLLNSLKDELTEAVRVFCQMRDNTLGIAEPGTRVLEVLQTQVWGNVVSTELLAHIVQSDPQFSRRIAPPGALIKRAISELEGLLQVDPYPIVLNAELIMTRYYRHLLARREAARAISRLRTQSNDPGQDLTDLDRAELERFERILERGPALDAGSPRTGTDAEPVSH